MNRENLIKKVIAKLKVKDLIPGGKDLGSPDSDFDKKQLQEGIRKEMEHTDDPEIAKEIAKDHLTESPRYYLTNDGGSRIDMLEEDANKDYEEEIAKEKE